MEIYKIRKRNSKLIYSLVLLALIAVSAPFPAHANKLDFDALMKFKWHKGQSQNFTVYSDLKPIKIEKMLMQLEDFATFCQIQLDVPEGKRNSKMTLFVAAKSKTWQRLGQHQNTVSRIFEHDGTTKALIRTDSGYNASLSGKSHVRVNLFASVARLQVGNSKYGSELPFWYRDGMARYLATYQRTGAKLSVGKLNSVLGRLRSIINATKQLESFDVGELIGRSQMPNPSDFKNSSAYLKKVNEVYSLNLMLVHYFNAKEDRRQQLEEYLALLSKGVSGQEALVKSTGMNLDQFGYVFYRYIVGQKLYARIFSYQEMSDRIHNMQGSSFINPEVNKIDAISAISEYQSIPIEFRTGHLSNEINQQFTKQVEQEQARVRDSSSIN